MSVSATKGAVDGSVDASYAITIDSLEVELTATITSASLAGYDSAKGFPDDGKSWLTIKFTDQATIYSAGGNSGYPSYKLDCSAITANGIAAKSCTTVSGNGGNSNYCC